MTAASRSVDRCAIRKIAVIGATGMLGIPVTVALLEAGFEVTALVRKPDEARRVLPAATQIVAADVRDEASLKRGLDGQDALYLNLSVAPTERRGGFHTEQQGLEHILAAARSAGIKRIGYLSAMIHDSPSRWWVLQVWRNAVLRIKGSGIPYTIFYPTNFMETLPQRHMLGGTFVMTGWSRNRNWWIAGRDFGRQVARSFMLPEAENREYAVQGPQPITYNEAGRRFARAAGARRLTLPLFFISIAGVVSPSMRFSGRIMRAVLRYPETFQAEATWRELGRPSMTVEEFSHTAANIRV
jgi:uncharacterized protein YbjT (DUF2867 family)